MAPSTVDLVLDTHTRAKMAEERVNDPEDSIVSEMIKQLPQDKLYEMTKCFQDSFMGLEDAPSSWVIAKMVFPRKVDAEHQKK